MGNNRLGNLELQRLGDHSAHHLLKRGRDPLGRFGKANGVIDYQ